jgi:hypothetical protein
LLDLNALAGQLIPRPENKLQRGTSVEDIKLDQIRIGGLQAFGGLGVFTGPIVLAITLALLKFLREEKRAGNWSFDRETSQSPPA